jgi:predicted RNA binding protein YcfA (HicA-like mRNA interferase family)
MPPLPVVSGSDVVKKLQRLGWVLVRQAGSHMILVKPDSLVSLAVPNHREIARGTLRSIIRSAGMTVEEFLLA